MKIIDERETPEIENNKKNKINKQRQKRARGNRSNSESFGAQ